MQRIEFNVSVLCITSLINNMKKELIKIVSRYIDEILLNKIFVLLDL